MQLDERKKRIAEALEQIRAGSIEAEADLVKLNAPLCLSLARQFRFPACVDLDDIMQEAAIVVVRCGRAFQARNAKWGTFVGACLWRAFQRIAASRSVQAVNCTDEDGMGYLAWIESSEAEGESHTVGLLDLLDRLPSREREAVRLRWRADTDEPFGSLRGYAEIGRLLACSRGNAEALVKSGYARLRDWITELEGGNG